MKAKPLEFKKLAKGFYQAMTIDGGSYCIYEPKTFPDEFDKWSIQVRYDSGVFSGRIRRDTLAAAKARCEELHQEAFSELIEYWGEK